MATKSDTGKWKVEMEEKLDAKLNSGIVSKVLVHFLNSQFAALILIGSLLWGLSNFTDAQIDTLDRIIQISDNWIGRMWFALICFFFFYALVLHPTGKFMANFLNSWAKVQTAHYTETMTHVGASKEMYRILADMNTTVGKIYEKVCSFYGVEK